MRTFIVASTAASLLACGLIAALVSLAWQTRDDALDVARLHVVQQARIQGDLSSRMLEAVDLALVSTVANLRSVEMRALMSPGSRHHALSQIALYLPQAASVETYDAWGNLDAESRQYPPRQLNAADAEFFGRFRDSGTDFSIGPPEPMAHTGLMVIPITRRLSDRDGNFEGIARALVRSGALSEAYRAEDNSGIDRAVLVNADGTILADSAPATQRRIGQPLSSVLPETRSNGSITDTVGLSSGLSADRIIAAYQLHDFPFRLVAWRDTGPILDGWWQGARVLVAAAVVVGVTTVLGVTLLARIERRRTAMEDDLRLYKRVLTAVGNGVLVTDALEAHNPIVYVNPAFEALTGYRAEEAVGRSPRILYGDDNDQPAIAQLSRAIDEQRDATAILRNVRKDGTPYWCDILVTPVRDERGVTRHFLGVLRDITERVEAEAAMRKANAELADSNAELEQFAYVASHDLQEPLRMVASYVQLIERRYRERLDGEGREFIAFAVEGVKRMQGMIIDLLEYSRVTRRGGAYKQVALDECLKEALSDLSFMVSETGAKIFADPMPEVTGDRVQLRRVLENLVGNALKYRAPDRAPEVRISARRDKDAWEISVADNGIGIAPEFHDRIFVLFQRLHSRDAYPGNGIGLSVCRKIVERHGGRIWLESAEGAGATFHFTLPVSPSPSPAA